MLWSLACNIAKRLLFETNNIASTVKMKPSSFYFIPAFCVFVFLFCTFFYWFFFLSFTDALLFVIYFSHFFSHCIGKFHRTVHISSISLSISFVFLPHSDSTIYIQRYMCGYHFTCKSFAFFCHWYVHSQDVPAGCSWLMFTFSSALVKQVLPNRVSRWYERDRER